MYFSSKEELLKYFIQEEITNMEEIVEEVEANNTDPFEAVNQAIYKILQYRKHQDFLNIIAKEAEWLKKPSYYRKSLNLIDNKNSKLHKNKLQGKRKRFCRLMI